MKLCISFLLAVAVSGLGYWFRALDLSGFWAAALVGAAIFWGAGLPGATVLIFFFASGSALSRLRSDIFAPEQKSRRDFKQVLANGLGAALLALGYGFWHEEVYYLAFVSTIATACADTTSGEVGIRWGRKTSSILNFRSIPPGVSGGVSPAGTLAGLAGALLVALVGVGPKGWDLLLSIKTILLVSAVGFAGMIFDSYLGALVQAKYRCVICRSAVEVPRHCRQSSERISGITVLDNDGVNFLATLFAGILGLLLF